MGKFYLVYQKKKKKEKKNSSSQEEWKLLLEERRLWQRGQCHVSLHSQVMDTHLPYHKLWPASPMVDGSPSCALGHSPLPPPLQTLPQGSPQGTAMSSSLRPPLLQVLNCSPQTMHSPGAPFLLSSCAAWRTALSLAGTSGGFIDAASNFPWSLCLRNGYHLERKWKSMLAHG